MALFGDTKETMNASLARADAMIELLKEENERLQKQVSTLQEAIVSKLAPLAYAEMKADESDDEEAPTNKEAISKWQEEMELFKGYAHQIEEPFFTGAEDMIDKLSQMAGFPMPGETSIHGNDES